MKTALRVVLAWLLSQTAGYAEVLSIPVTGGTVLTSPDSKIRILLELAAPSGLENASVGHAVLRLPRPIMTPGRELRVLLRPIRSPWSLGTSDWRAGWETPGGDVHRDLVGRVTLGETTGSELSVDVTGLMHGVLEGASFHGLLVSVPDGEGNGFEVADGLLLRAFLEQAVLDVTYRRIPDRSRLEVRASAD